MDQNQQYIDDDNGHQTIKFFEAMLDATSDGFLITDSQSNIVKANSAFASIFGRSPQRLMGTRIFPLLEQLDGDAKSTWLGMENDLKSAGTCHDIDFMLNSEDGIVHLKVNAFPMKNIPGAEQKFFLSVWRDVKRLVKQDRSSSEEPATDTGQ